MPFYEYQCKNCGHELEAMQKVSDAPLRKCPDCGKSQLERLMSAPVFRLKGAGWYETDFKDDKDKKRNLADRVEADTAKEGDTKAESKTEAKAESKTEPVSEAAKTKDKPAEKPVEKAPEGKVAKRKGNLATRVRTKKPAGKASRKR